jgi:hypothetical protein
MTVGQYTPWMKNGNKDQVVAGTDFLTTWLNNYAVRDALNIDKDAGEWTMCSDPVYG